MRRTVLFMALAAFMVGMGIAGCVNTTLQTDWRDPGFRGTFRKVIVICLAKEMVVRNTLEDDIGAQFSSRGVAVIPSYTLFPELKGVTRDMVKEKIRETGADGVFLVRPIGKDAIQVRGYTDVLYPETTWYEQWDKYSQVPPNVNTVEIYRVETSLFETGGNKIVWQAISDTFESGPWMDTLKEFARVMGAKLIEHRLI